MESAPPSRLAGSLVQPPARPQHVVKAVTVKERERLTLIRARAAGDAAALALGAALRPPRPALAVLVTAHLRHRLGQLRLEQLHEVAKELRWEDGRLVRLQLLPQRVAIHARAAAPLRRAVGPLQLGDKGEAVEAEHDVNKQLLVLALCELTEEDLDARLNPGGDVVDALQPARGVAPKVDGVGAVGEHEGPLLETAPAAAQVCVAAAEEARVEVERLGRARHKVGRGCGEERDRADRQRLGRLVALRDRVQVEPDVALVRREAPLGGERLHRAHHVLKVGVVRVGEAYDSHWCERNTSGWLAAKLAALSHVSQKTRADSLRASSKGTSRPKAAKLRNGMTQNGKRSDEASLIAARTRRNCARRSRAAAASASRRWCTERRAQTQRPRRRRRPTEQAAQRMSSRVRCGTQVAPRASKPTGQPQPRSAVPTRPSGHTARTARVAQGVVLSASGDRPFWRLSGSQPQGSSSRYKWRVKSPVREGATPAA
mmetsp:Transcript_14774/g.42335  ORF Transcript_14774/g.42335 Transcript_14774/m.42335 type:complete len:487 (-) Transcript_14774:3334-4794(-)